MTHALRAVLFDMDGTPLDTAPEMVGTVNARRGAEDWLDAGGRV
jgi:hypothetical protein